jgi:hypothetical protein
VLEAQGDIYMNRKSRSVNTRRIVGGVLLLPFILGVVAGAPFSGFGALVALLGTVLILDTYRLRSNHD